MFRFTFFLFLGVAIFLVGAENKSPTLKKQIPDERCNRCPEEYGSLSSGFSCVNSCYNPSCHNPCLQGYVNLTFLMWQAKEDGLEFAANNTAPSAAPNINFDGKNISPDFSWMPAFKIALGAIFPSSDWSLISEYTFFFSKSSTSAKGKDVLNRMGLFPFWTVFTIQSLAAPPLYARADSHWKLHFHTLDLSLGHDFAISRFMNMRFHGGVKGAIIDQRYLIQYKNDQGVTDSVGLANIFMKNDARGIGPRFGIESKWHFPKGNYLLANIASSLLYQQFRVFFKTDEELFPIGENLSELKNRESTWLWQPALEMLLGWGWGFCFGRERGSYFSIKLCYETQYFWEQNLLSRFNNYFIIANGIPSKGDLLLHGGNLAFQFDF